MLREKLRKLQFSVTEIIAHWYTYEDFISIHSYCVVIVALRLFGIKKKNSLLRSQSWAKSDNGITGLSKGGDRRHRFSRFHKNVKEIAGLMMNDCRLPARMARAAGPSSL